MFVQKQPRLGLGKMSATKSDRLRQRGMKVQPDLTTPSLPKILDQYKRKMDVVFFFFWSGRICQTPETPLTTYRQSSCCNKVKRGIAGKFSFQKVEKIKSSAYEL